MKKLKLKRSILSIILTMILIMNSVVVPVYASSVVSYNSRNTFKISSANDFPEVPAAIFQGTFSDSSPDMPFGRS